MNIGEFLLRRLAEVGTTHAFGVPGDYNMSFLEQLEAHPTMRWMGNCNELNAAYAADGYARSGKPGVLITTYGVGCLSALNGVAGAYCERIPLIHISGAPPAHAVRDRKSLHHSLLDGGYRNVHRAFAEFTEYSATISTDNAVEVIDHALRAAFRSRRPVRLELPSDLTHVDIATPEDTLTVGDAEPAHRDVLAAAGRLSEMLSGARRPVVVFDAAAVRWGALPAIERFCAQRDIPYFCTLPAVHYADPTAEQYQGMLPGSAGQAIFDDSDLVITCGFTRSDVTTACFTLDFSGRSVVRLEPTYTQLSDSTVYYGTTIDAVLGSVDTAARPRWWHTTPRGQADEPDGGELTEAFFFGQLQRFLRGGDVLVAETGTSAQNTVGMSLPEGVSYINQSSWGSIGYALPALFGSLVARPDRRHVLCTGDGSFQVTAQELSSVIRHGFAPVIFLLNNRGYTIERSILGATSAYNDVADWVYPDVPRAFGIDDDRLLAAVCTTRSELRDALAAAADTDRLVFIEVALQPLDMTAATAAVGEATRVFDYGVNGPPNR
ncbi:thiamine pyrophosphate-binding protein [Mycolicibacterium neoaurum]|uniref:alpha-keto acid decarboxylase family protein n=1 Tax=Mycolicibacterium neoaurum TaxID=1795 RepID=UPI002673006C|nr:thiamine pyrophosphate-binding protein [Mycolicibacterium neoaurum]MDO3403329.1 thiamine pyrophosphate-binding protein [Mycolicibacterium neoaurum]